MRAEATLGEVRHAWSGTSNTSLPIFGTPAAAGWGWRVEGHHVSLNFTVINGALVASAPSFFGSNPAEVRDGREEGPPDSRRRGRLGSGSADGPRPAQRAKAVMSATAPNDIATMNTVKINPLTPPGIAAATLTPNQREKLMSLVDRHIPRWRATSRPIA